jgi:hypothetical protein
VATEKRLPVGEKEEREKKRAVTTNRTKETLN